MVHLKPALSYKSHVSRLKNYHKLEIKDIEKAQELFRTVNYYRLSVYGIGLKQKDNTELYLPGVSIEQLYDLYCFDSQFRNKLIHTIEQIEIMLRTQIAYLIAIKYGADGLENPNNFQNKINKSKAPIYRIIVDKIQSETWRQCRTPFVEHHIKKYGGKFPIWVAIELMSFGNLCSLYNIMKESDQKEIAKLYDTTPVYLLNWMLCLVEVRNICAHYTRLYNMPLKTPAKLYKESQKYLGKQHKIFPVLLIIKRILSDNEQWKNLKEDIVNTMRNHEETVNTSYMGFPQDWEEVLSLPLKRFRKRS